MNSNPPGFRNSDFGPLTADLMKPRADARLKTLPPERQAGIVEFARTHTLAQTAQWLGEHGLKTSISAVSQFLRWHRTKKAMTENETSLRKDLLDLVRKDPSGHRVQTVGHTMFSLLAIEKLDPINWCRIQSVPVRRNFCPIPKPNSEST